MGLNGSDCIMPSLQDFLKTSWMVMREKSNICSYLDMPLQHGSSKILKIMRRGIDRPKTEALVHRIREKVPGIALRTTLIAGHPGETEEDFEDMYEFVEKMRFDRLGIFTYSHEENTHSHNLKDDVPEELKQERANDVMELQEKISGEINESRVGKVFKVLIDRKEGDSFIGRTEFDSPEVDNEVYIDAKKHFLRIGDFANIKINRASAFDLYGDPVI